MAPGLILSQGDQSHPLPSYKSAIQTLTQFDPGSPEDNELTRSKALEAAKELVRILEPPEKTAMHWAYEVASERMAVRFGVDCGIFKKLAEQQASPMTSLQLSEQCGCEELLLVRMMRAITILGFADEVEPQTYLATSRTHAIAEPAVSAGTVICHNFSGAVESRIHEYFQEFGYRCPTDVNDGPFQWYFNTKSTYFDYLYQDPQIRDTFATFMAGWRLKRTHWSSWFPVRDELSEYLHEESAPLFVDIGGNKGHDLAKLLKVLPEAKDRLILQDLPGVLEGVSHEGIVCMSYDFFTPQPVLGARAYYMHFILHDWPDYKSVEILKNVKAAMEPGVSRLYINEHVMPEKDAPLWLVAIDLNMMCNFGSMERTRTQWTQLLGSAGLEIVKFWQPSGKVDTEWIIEAKL